MYVVLKKSKDQVNPESCFYGKNVDIFLVATFLHFFKREFYVMTKPSVVLAESYIKNTLFPNRDVKIKREWFKT